LLGRVHLGDGATLTVLKFPDEPVGTLELVHRPADGAVQLGTGFSHLAVQVDDLAGARQTLIAAEPTGRLAFRPVEERTQLVTLMAGILDGTLDAHGRADLATMSPEEAAVRQYEDELMSYGVPASRMGQLRPDDQHDMELRR
jgi:hypothetical protein